MNSEQSIAGPWEAAADEPTVYAADGNQVCQVFPSDFSKSETGGLPERMALIAAAPELLAAIAELLRQTANPDPLHPAWRKARANAANAYNKATGQAVQS